jgi:hypothetical protein
MKEFFARLNPMERRFVVGVIVVFFLVGNIVWVWPHFSDWGKTKTRMNTASDKHVLFQQGIAKIPALKRDIDKYQKQGDVVPAEDQAVGFVRLIQKQAAQSRVMILDIGGRGRQAGTTNNPFFVEQNQTVRLQSGEKELVDFLYNLGVGNSLIRVKVLSVQPDQSHQQLSSGVTLIASYQRKTPVARGATPAAAPAAKAPAATVPKPPVTKPPMTSRPMTNPPVPVRPLAPKPITPIKK